MKIIVHNPQECIAALLRTKPRGRDDAAAVSNAVACMNHMQNVIQRQRKNLADMQKKATP